MPPAFDFPGAPSLGDVFTDPSGASYNWNGYAWMGGAANSLGALVVSDTPPAAPANNSLWFESDTGMLFLRYNDGNSSQWVQVNALPDGAGYATIPYVNSVTYGLNRIINGDMIMDARNGAAAVQPASGTYAIDRWKYQGGQPGKITTQRTTAGAALQALGFAYQLSITTAVAYTAAAAEGFQIYQPIEAYNITDFAWGTANAQPVTLSFWVWSNNLTGTFSGCVGAGDGNRSYPFIFNIPTAATWTKIVINIPGDTGGTWVLTGQAAGVTLHFDLGSGANYRGAANAWVSANLVGVTGTVSPLGTLNQALVFSGVKLEIGPIATPFIFESFVKRLADCQRYFCTGQALLQGYGVAGTPIYASAGFPVTMRTGAVFTTTQLNNSNVSAVAYAPGINCVAVQCTVTATGNFAVNTTFKADADL